MSVAIPSRRLSPPWFVGEIALLLLINTTTVAAMAEDWPYTDGYHANDCGITALEACLAVNRREVSPGTLIALLRKDDDDDHPLSLAALKKAAEALGARTIALRWAAEPLPGSPPAVVAVTNRRSLAHFVALLRMDRHGALVLDFPWPARRVTWGQLRAAGWDGVALHVSGDADQLARLARASEFAFEWPAFGGVVIGSVLYAGWRRFFGCATAQPRPSFARAKPSRAKSPSGFSLVEVVVVMAIIGLLISILLPAVQSALEASHRVSCQNRLRQLAMACTQHHAVHRRYPASPGRYTDGRREYHRNASALVALLPFVDQQAIYDQFDFDEDGRGVRADPAVSARNAALLRTRVAVFECPSDETTPGATNYRVCLGTGPGRHETVPYQERSAKRGAFGLTAKRDADIRDGLSTTIFFSERLVGDRVPSVYTPARDIQIVTQPNASFLFPDDAAKGCRNWAQVGPPHVSFAGSSWMFSGYNHTWYNHVLPPNHRTPDCALAGNGSELSEGAISARSWHPGGVFAGFGDGSVRFVTEGVSLNIWRAWSSIVGQETIELD